MLLELVGDGMALKSTDLIAARGVYQQPIYLLCLCMDKLQLKGQNLGRVFNSRRGRLYTMRSFCYRAKTVQLKLENLGQTAFRFSPV
jgi:hypothetical protein